MDPRSNTLLSLFLGLSLAAAPRPAAAAGNIEPAPASGATAQLVARILEEGHYDHKPVAAETSRELLKLYLRRYDPYRLFFLASDIEEFDSRFGPGLAPRLRAGDVEPAYFIFNRFMARLEERVGWVRAFARSTYTFTSEGSILADRKEAPWPADGAAALALWRQRVEYDLLNEKLSSAKPEDQAANVVKSYDRLLENYREFDPADVLQGYLTALANCFDPHSEYMGPPAKDNFDISLSLSLVGIGVTLQTEEGYAKILAVIPGSPAAASKALHLNDRIEAVAQGTDGAFVEAVGMRIDRLVKLIRGEKGTVVRLRIIPADALDPSVRAVVALVRDKILLREQKARAQVVLVPGQDGRDLKLGVIKLPSFYTQAGPAGSESAALDVKVLLGHLTGLGADGIILDLRDNGGGSLEEAVTMTGLFTGGGPVVQVKDSRGGVRVLSAPPGPPDYAGPLVTLDSRFSASASEIVSAALKDRGRAVLVGGESTFGKGTVQQVLDLDSFMPLSLRRQKPGAVRLTSQKFYRVSGGSTQNRGVVPDITLPSLSDHLEMTESSLPNAMAYDEISPAAYDSAGPVSREQLDRLRAASLARVAASPEFRFVKQDIALYLERRKEKTVSLNYAKRLAEREVEKARQAGRNKERAARKAAPLPVAELTLEDIAAGKPLVFNSTAAVISGVAASTAAAVGAEVSTAPAAGVELSTAAASGDYDRAPPVPDFVLEESAYVLADLIAAASRRNKAGEGEKDRR